MQLSDTETRLSQSNRQLVLWEVSCVFVLRLFPSLYGRLGGGGFGQGEQMFVSFLLLLWEEMRDRKWRRISVSLFSRKAPVWFGQTMPNRRDQGRV